MHLRGMVFFMIFLLRSEVESLDIKNNYYKKRVYCPYCSKIQLKKLDSNKVYNKYQCWNKNCEYKDVPFVVLNLYIQNEDYFDDICDICQQHYHREFIVDNNGNILLYFRCNEKLCESNIEPYCYNIRKENWEGKSPKFTLLDETSNSSSLKPPRIEKSTEIIEKIEEQKNDPIEFVSKEFLEQRIYDYAYKIEDIPLLSMDDLEYSNFLEHHQDKVVVLVDMPNFIRTLRDYYRRNFEDALKRAHQLLLEYIEKSFYTSSNYIIRYFSKPDKDLQIPNKIIINFCTENQDKEYFHLFKILKGARYSDIDNYLIANGVEILERCNIKGFVIVSSDKDYLPVMRIASYKNVKSRIVGINTPEIYEKYNIEGIKFLGIMKFFDS